MKLIKLIILITISFWFQKAQAQQALQFSQYMFNGLSVNPAYAGYKGDWNVQAIYRKQWVSFPGAPESGVISLDGLTGYNNEKIGVGVQVNTDQLGPQKALSVYGNISYRLPLDNNNTKRLCFGISFGGTQYSLSTDALVAKDPNDPLVTASQKAYIRPDARVGVYYYAPKFYLGASVLDLLSVYSSKGIYVSGGNTFQSIQRTQHLYITAGYLLKLSERFNLRPSLLIKDNFKSMTNVDLNTFLIWNSKLWLGASYRTGLGLWSGSTVDKNLTKTDALSGLVEFFITPNLRVGYAYDWMLNSLSSAQTGSHELSLGLTIPKKKKLISEVGPRFF